MQEEIDIIKYIWIIKKGWKLLVSVFICAEVFTLILVLITPPLYDSMVTILPPEALVEKGVLVSGRLPNLIREEFPTGLFGRETASFVITAMLKSNRMAMDVAKEFSLQNQYKGKSVEGVAGKLRKTTTISMTKEGVISVTVRTGDPKLSAEIANFYAANLDKINDELKITSQKPIVTILDPAVPSFIPSSPKKMLSLIIAGMFAVFIGVALILFLNYFQELKKYSPVLKSNA